MIASGIDPSGWKICQGPCGRWRPVTDYPHNAYRLDKSRTFAENVCAFCKRHRERRRYWEDPEIKREYMRRHRAWIKGLAISRSGSRYLPAAPFIAWLERQVELRQGSVGQLAADVRMNERRIRTIMSGRYRKAGRWYPIKRVSLEVIDNALTYEGSTFLWEIYSDL